MSTPTSGRLLITFECGHTRPSRAVYADVQKELDMKHVIWTHTKAYCDVCEDSKKVTDIQQGDKT